MENPFEAGHEELQHTEHLRARRLKVVITVAILLVTMLTTLTGVLAALWGARQSETQRARQQATADVLQNALHATALQDSLDQRRDDVKEVGWRTVDLRARADLVAKTTLPASLAKELRRQATLTDGQHTKLDSALPQQVRDSYDAYVADLHEPQTKSEQDALSEARQSVAWLGKHNSALAVVSMLALALFLLGLALTLSNRATQIGFTVLALVMLVVSGARLAQIGASPVSTVSESCIEHYVAGYTALNASATDAAAAHSFEAATSECPKYPDAWEQLGYARFYQSISADKTTNTTNLAASQQAFQQALNLSPTRSANLYNSLGYIETLNKDYSHARTNLAKALELQPDDPTVLGTQAELTAALGNEAAAENALQQSVKLVATHGPYYRDQYFASLRLDELIFEIHDYALYQRLVPFYDKAREIEASIDIGIGSEPGDAHGATVDHLKVARATGAFGKGGAVTISFQYSGMQNGDHLSVRFYQDSITYELAASEPNILLSDDPNATVPQGVDDVVNLVGTGREPANNFVRPLAPGNQTAEIYLNGVLLATSDAQDFHMPTGTANGG